MARSPSLPAGRRASVAASRNGFWPRVPGSSSRTSRPRWASNWPPPWAPTRCSAGPTSRIPSRCRRWSRPPSRNLAGCTSW
ncbi:hypothetical protein NC652_030369 [Populus alba x Populus x berolinensis]|nr:hypothetical protein NC652_030369 [Populus alba x Populus x berolinensis]